MTALTLAIGCIATAFAQIERPMPPIVIPPGIPGGGGGGGPIIIVPPIGPGVPTNPEPTISVSRGALVGQTVTASVDFVTLGALPETGSANPVAATHQWSITGARLTSDPRERSVSFVADRAGIVTLAVVVGANGTSYSPTAQVTIFASDSAGALTAPATVMAGAATITATATPARNADRTFRWTVTGDAAIATGQGSASVTIRPGTAGLKELTCHVTLQTLVTIPVRAYLLVTGNGPPVDVLVNQGSGGGAHRTGSRVEILADPPGPGEVFDRWVGDTDLLVGDALAPVLARATLTVPARPVTLTATYRPVAPWSPTVIPAFNVAATGAASGTSTAATASALFHHVPPAAVGLVFLLHDTARTAADWFERPEELLLVRELVAAGYGVAALSSANRTAGTWSSQATLTGNVDAQNHAAAFDRLVADGALPAATPVFFLGVGAGGDAAARVADLLATARPARPVRGAVAYLAAGSESTAVLSRVPQFFLLATNDETLGAAGLATARTHQQLLLGRGIPTELVSHTVAPLPPARLRMLGLNDPDFTAADAQSIWNAVRDAGALDANAYVKSVPAPAALTTALPPALQARAADVAAQLTVAAAGRTFFADANRRVIAFLQARTVDQRAPAPGRIVNLSTRSQIAYLGDSVTLGFTLTGTQPATVLLRGVGPTLGRFGVTAPLPALRLELRSRTASVGVNEAWDRGTNAAPLAAAAASVGAFALTPGSLDTALLVQLNPGTYLATLTGLNGAVGPVLAELYDVSRNGTRLTNLSVLGRLSSAGETLISGVAVAGTLPRTVIVRAVGPSLSAVGVPAHTVLADPRVTLFNGNQPLATNNNWAQAGAATLTAAFPVVGAFPLPNANDAALVHALPPGSYTLEVGAAPGLPALTPPAIDPDTGTVLVEIYELP